MNVRHLALAAAGASAFIDMYATQPLLPEFRLQFHASEAAVSATVSALIFATAIAALFVGPIADRIGRKRIIVGSIICLGIATLATSTATSLSSLVAWRFVQGLFMPGIFTVTLAYIAEEFPAGVGGAAVGAYVGGNVFGGFFGRYLAALVDSHSNWHVVFVVLGCLNFVGATIVIFALPRSKNFKKATSLRATLDAVGTFLRNPVLLATDAIGAGALFTIVGVFTYITFHLSQAPFLLGTAALGYVFFVYIVPIVAVPISGRFVDTIGHRKTLLGAQAIGITGLLITLVPSLPVIIIGLVLMASGTFCVQATSQGYVGAVAATQRSTAAAIYIACYYLGGGLGATLPAFAWTHGGWPPTVAFIVAVQCGIALLAYFAWPAIAVPRAPAAVLP